MATLRDVLESDEFKVQLFNAPLDPLHAGSERQASTDAARCVEEACAADLASRTARVKLEPALHEPWPRVHLPFALGVQEFRRRADGISWRITSMLAVAVLAIVGLAWLIAARTSYSRGLVPEPANGPSPALLQPTTESSDPNTMFDNFVGFIPRLLAAVVIFLVGSFIAGFLRKAIEKVLGRLGVDRLVDRSGLGGPFERAGYPDSGQFLAKMLWVMLMLAVASLALNALGIAQLQDLFDQLIAWIPKVFVALNLVIVTGAVGNFVNGLLGGWAFGQRWGNLPTNVAVGGIWFVGGSMAIDQLGIDRDVLDTLVTAVFIVFIVLIAIKFVVGGIWEASDRFWPAMHTKIRSAIAETDR